MSEGKAVNGRRILLRRGWTRFSSVCAVDWRSKAQLPAECFDGELYEICVYEFCFSNGNSVVFKVEDM